MSLKVGDYITHIDHGIGKFMGLVKLPTMENTRMFQIDVIKQRFTHMFLSIRFIKFQNIIGPDGREIVLNKLGSPTWKTLKQNQSKS